MEREVKSEVKCESPAIIGTIWFIGWIFTIGFVKLVWWKAIIALVFWGYYLGAAVR